MSISTYAATNIPCGIIFFLLNTTQGVIYFEPTRPGTRVSTQFLLYP